MKNLIYVLFLCVVALLLIGCPQKETLTIFHYLDQADQVSVQNFEELRAEFEKQNPDVAIEFDFLVNEPYHNKLQALAVADELPDVMFLWPGKRTGQVTSSGKIRDLRPFLQSDSDLFAAAAVTPQGSGGELWELPEQVTATHVMYVNERLLGELGLSMPSTMSELVAQGATIRDAGYIPIAMDNKDGWQMQSTFLSALVARTGGRDWLDAARVGDASFTDPEFVEALRVIQTLSDSEMLSPGINQAEYGVALSAFVNEEAVYFIDGGWRVNNLTGEMTDEQFDYVTISVFPELANENGIRGATAVVAGTGFGMSADLDDAKAEQAWKWIWFYSGPEGSAIRQKHGALPAAQIPRPPDFPALSAKLADFLAVVPGGYVIDAVMDGEGMGVLHPAIQEMMFGNKSPEEVASEYEAWVAANDSGRKG